jgi:Ca2+-binding RTX toxin-like protein
MSVWDGGGTDTYDLSAYTSALDVDLNPGGHSTFSDDQRAWLGGGPNDGLARGNVFNARLFAGDPRSLIENAVGGSGDDRILGNVAANSLDGGPGADRMIGGPGDDRYFADDSGDRTIEINGGGTDTVVTSVDGKLGRNLENLALTGQAASAIGNGLDNCLTGNSGGDTLRGRGGNDRLAGGFGPDVLVGGAGADVFCFADARESRRGAPDTIRPGNGAPAFENAGPGAGDLIDLSAIDADPSLAGNQDFILDQSRGPGHVWFLERHGETVLRASAGSGGEMKLVIDDGAVPSLAYGAADFLGIV